MPEQTIVQAGNAPKEYKDLALDTSGEGLLVRAWRQKIEKAVVSLDMEGRVQRAIEGDEYLNGTKRTKDKATYCNYLFPALEALHRLSVPRLPGCDVEAKSQAAEDVSIAVRELIDKTFAALKPDVEELLDDLQWDDDRSGLGVLRAEWQTKSHDADPRLPNDPEQIAPHVEKAMAENLDPLGAAVSPNDNDFVHHGQHLERLRAMDEVMAQTGQTPIGMEQLRAHDEEHAGRLSVIDVEEINFRRVPWDWFLYDSKVPWPERTWEVEKRVYCVGELMDWGWKNLNPENCPLEETPEGEQVPFEDMKVSVWEIHDRREQKLLVISTKGPMDGRFLHKEKWRYQDNQGEIDVYLPLATRRAGNGRMHGLATVQLAIPILERLAKLDFANDRHVENAANYKEIGPKGALSSEDKAALNDPNRRRVELPDEWLRGWKMVMPPSLPPANLEQRQILLTELQRILGVDSQNMGAEYQHQITATESTNREGAAILKANARQKAISRLLAKAAMTVQRLYKRFGTLAVPLRTVSDVGAEYQTFNTQDIPDDITATVDLEATSEQAQAQDRQALIAVEAYFEKGFYPVDHTTWGEFFARGMGVKRPERFRSKAPAAGVVNPGAPMPTMAGVGSAPGGMPQPQPQPPAMAPQQQ